MGWKQIVCIATLALLVGQSAAITTEVTATPVVTAAPVTAPLINYTCSIDGTITIKTTNLDSTKQRIAIGQDIDESLVLAYPKNDSNNCKHAESTFGSQDIEMKGCDTSLPIYVYLMNQANSNIVGGKNNYAYELNCYFPKDGIERVVTANNISVKSPSDYSNEMHKFDLGEIGLTMTITPKTPHLGDKLTLNISETNQGLYVLPMDCTATGGVLGSNEKTELLTDGQTEDVNLLENFKITNGSAVASMYAFRFKSSEVVRVTCNVTICQTKECGGAYTTTITTTTMPETTVTPQSGRRRRRSVEKATPGRTYDVSAAFEILDNDPNESSSSSTSVRVNPLLTGLSLLCLWAVASSKTY